MSKYIGITIGPIVRTICMTSSPAALWYASGFFSDVARRICAKISEDRNLILYSPYYDGADKNDDGIGKFNDRIYFSANDEYDCKDLDLLINAVKEDVKNAVCIDDKEKNYLDKYLQINYIILDQEQYAVYSKNGTQNIILTISYFLDVLELVEHFPPDNESNPFAHLFAGEYNGGNRLVKKSELFKRVKKPNNQLINGQNSIRTIEEIALHGTEAASSTVKPCNYFAVVYADGDGMGTFLKGIDNEKLKDFSEVCFGYASESARLIGEFGGMTIYAGGDDLLFLAPVVSNGKTVFELCQNISGEFKNLLKEKNFGATTLPTLSFGISIQYIRYPLYEALENSRKLLSDAKGYDDENEEKKDNQIEKKDCIAVSLTKHSGQTLKLLFKNDKADVINEILKANAGEQELKSLLYALELHKDILAVAENKGFSEAQFKNLLKNIFDNAGQQEFKDYIERIMESYYKDFIQSDKPWIISDERSEQLDGSFSKGQLKEHDKLRTFMRCIKFKKFLYERKGE